MTSSKKYRNKYIVVDYGSLVSVYSTRLDILKPFNDGTPHQFKLCLFDSKLNKEVYPQYRGKFRGKALDSGDDVTFTVGTKKFTLDYSEFETLRFLMEELSEINSAGETVVRLTKAKRKK